MTRFLKDFAAMWMIPYVTMTLLMVLGIFLIFIILLQRGRGGGLAGALGGMGGQSAFGTKAGDTFTTITIWLAVFWVVCAAGNVYALRMNTTKFKGSDDDIPTAQSLDSGSMPGSISLDDLSFPPSKDGPMGSTTDAPAGSTEATTPAAPDEAAAEKPSAETPAPEKPADPKSESTKPEPAEPAKDPAPAKESAPANPEPKNE